MRRQITSLFYKLRLVGGWSPIALGSQLAARLQLHVAGTRVGAVRGQSAAAPHSGRLGQLGAYWACTFKRWGDDIR